MEVENLLFVQEVRVMGLSWRLGLRLGLELGLELDLHCCIWFKGSGWGCKKLLINTHSIRLRVRARARVTVRGEMKVRMRVTVRH